MARGPSVILYHGCISVASIIRDEEVAVWSSSQRWMYVDLRSTHYLVTCLVTAATQGEFNLDL